MIPALKGAILSGERAAHCNAWGHCGNAGNLCKKGCTDQDVVWVVGLDWPKESCIRWGPGRPVGMGKFERGRGPVLRFKI